MKLEIKNIQANFIGFLIFTIFYILWDIRKLHIDLRIILFLWGAYFIYSNYKFIDVKFFFIPFILTLHLLFIHFAYGAEIQLRSFLSIIFVYLSILFFNVYKKDFPFFLFKSASIFFSVNLLIQLLEILGVLSLSTRASPFLPNTPRFSGLFNEPSHLALFYAPFLATFFSNVAKFRKYIDFKFISFAIISLIIAPSTTMLFIFLISIILQFFFQRSLKSTFLLILFTCFLLTINDHLISLSYRLAILFDYISLPNFGYLSNPFHVIDITSLVLLYNYNTVIFGLINFPFGVGINSYELLNHAFKGLVDFNDIYPVAELNFNDGASNLFKFFGEFGMFSLLPLAIMFKKVIKFYKENDFMFIFSLLLIVGTFGRGVGYFSSGFFFSLLYLFLYNKT